MVREDIESFKVSCIDLCEREVRWDPLGSLACLLAQQDLLCDGGAPQHVLEGLATHDEVRLTHANNLELT